MIGRGEPRFQALFISEGETKVLTQCAYLTTAQQQLHLILTKAVHGLVRSYVPYLLTPSPTQKVDQYRLETRGVRRYGALMGAPVFDLCFVGFG